MKKNLYALAACAMMAVAPMAQAQDLVAEKEVHPLGGFKTWTKDNGDTFTQTQAELNKLTAVPTNTANVYLYPEGGWDTAANKEIGIQGIWIDMGAEYEVGTVSTTWEGACAGYSLWLTDVEPTGVPTAEPLATAGKSTDVTTKLPEGSKGRYLVLQPDINDVANLGWGVKMRSIKAMEAQEDVLTTFTASPAFVIGEAEMTFTFANQFGIAIDAENVTVSVTDGDATLVGNKLTINGTGTVELSATMGDKTLTTLVYSPVAPATPAVGEIKTPVFTNGKTDDNAKVEWGVGYNGGAVNLGTVTFTDGNIAQGFSPKANEANQCVFFSNSETTGVWTADIDPTELGYKTLELSVYGTKDVTGRVVFEQAVNNEHPFELKAGEWTKVTVDLTGETKLHTMSVRFAGDNKCDFLLTNIYFTPAFIEGDEQAPVLDEVTAVPADNSVTLTLKATDDLNPVITFNITDGAKTWTAIGRSGEAMEYEVRDLYAGTDYTFTVTASDGLNTSEARTVAVKTTGERVPVITLECSNPVATGATTGTVDYKITWEPADVEGLKFRIFAVTTGEKAVSDVIETDQAEGKLELMNLNDCAVTELWVKVTAYTDKGTATNESQYPGEKQGWTGLNVDTSAFAGVANVGAGIDGEAEYYTLQGVRVSNPTKGIYIVVKNGKGEKVRFM